MIRSTCRRAGTVLAVASAVVVSGLPLFSGTALAATITASPSTAPNSGDASVTLTGGPGMALASGATLTKHGQPGYAIPASNLASNGQANQRVATFPLLNKLPGGYDITVSEPSGNETCTSCFTITGLPPTVDIALPDPMVTGQTNEVTVTVSNPARGDNFATTRVEMALSALAGLQAANMTITADVGGTSFPVDVQNGGGSEVDIFLGPPDGTPVGQNQDLVINVHFDLHSGAPTGKVNVDTTFGDVNTSTGALTDALATASTITHLSAAGSGSTYHGLTPPVRVLDTRFNNGHAGALPPGGALTLVVGGVNPVPAGATAVAINLTATGGTSHGFLEAYPAGVARPTTGSNVNYPQGVSVANLAVVPLNATTHALTISNLSAGSVHVVGDVVGYYDTAGAGYHPLAPARVADTRTGPGAPIVAGGKRVFTIAGAGGVPATGATSVAINLTATRPQAHGYLKAFPTGSGEPVTSNVNFGAGETIANLALVPLSSSGQITVSNHSAGNVHVIIDVQGYFAAGSSSSMHPIAITRVLDTRSGSGQPIAGNTARTISLGGTHGLPTSGFTMVAVNVTVTQPLAGGHIITYANLAPRPSTSNANFFAGQTIANLAYVKTDANGGLIVYNASSSPIHLIVDLEGWGSSP
ncbi:MAG: hypothetical protein ACJ735_01910 [Actinomycetes bacterium]